MLLAGGLVLGAVFMATDMVTSPITRAGCWIYGSLIGVLVVVIRVWGGMPEGVMYAILLGNAAAPHLDRAAPAARLRHAPAAGGRRDGAGSRELPAAARPRSGRCTGRWSGSASSAAS